MQPQEVSNGGEDKSLESEAEKAYEKWKDTVPDPAADPERLKKGIADVLRRYRDRMDSPSDDVARIEAENQSIIAELGSDFVERLFEQVKRERAARE